MDWTPLSLNTLTTQVPKIYNDNLIAFKQYLDVFYNEGTGIIIAPVDTTGRIKAATGQFVNVVVDNLTVKKQFTNLLDNYTVIDSAFVGTFTGADTSTRIATSDPSSIAYIDSSTVVWPLEPSAYTWIDVQSPYIKINNDASYGLQNDNIGQEFRLLFNEDAAGSDFTILVDSSEGGQQNLIIDASDAPTTWIKLITTSWDASYGSTWTVKEYGGVYNLS